MKGVPQNVSHEGLRILIADDDAAVRKALRSMLSSHPHWSVCGEAADGLEAVESAKRLRPDIVLMDISMPRMDGLKATKIIREGAPDCEVLIVSQNDPSIVAQQAASVDAGGFVAKSSLGQDLIPAIGRIFPARPGKPKSGNGDGAKVPSAKPDSPRSRVSASDHAASLLAAIVDSSFDAIVSKNLDGVITSWNKSAEQIFGYTAEEAIGQNITLIIPPDRLNEETEILARIRRGERLEHFDTVRRRKDGTPIHVELTISPVKDARGRIIGASKVARDNTERKLAAERERQITVEAMAATAKFRAVFEQTTVFAGIMSKDGALVEANRVWVEACGYKLEDVLGLPLWETPWWREYPESQEKIRAAATQAVLGVPYREILKYSWADGSERLVDFALYPILDHKGEVLFLHPSGVDITDLKRGEQAYRKLAESLDAEVRERTKELEERNLELQRRSDEIRVLSRRMMQIQDNERRYIARELHDSAGQMLTVLGIDLARIRQEAKRAPKIAKLARETEELIHQLSQEIRTTSYLLHPPLLDESGLRAALGWYVRGLSERSGLDIQLNIPQDFGRLTEDLELIIFRLVQECLTNIHRHSGSKTATINLSRRPETVFLEVQDQGKGISAGKLAEIQSQSPGVGIRGMRERASQFGGQIDIESSSSGTRVLVTLPAPVIPESNGGEPRFLEAAN